MTEETIQTKCTNCGYQHQAQLSWVNQEVTCTNCGKLFLVSNYSNSESLFFKKSFCKIFLPLEICIILLLFYAIGQNHKNNLKSDGLIYLQLVLLFHLFIWVFVLAVRAAKQLQLKIELLNQEANENKRYINFKEFSYQYRDGIIPGLYFIFFDILIYPFRLVFHYNRLPNLRNSLWSEYPNLKEVITAIVTWTILAEIITLYVSTILIGLEEIIFAVGFIFVYCMMIYFIIALKLAIVELISVFLKIEKNTKSTIQRG